LQASRDSSSPTAPRNDILGEYPPDDGARPSSSHYFQTALDLTFCIRDPARDESKRPGFYLVKVMGSEQAGLAGLKGGVVRKVAVDRSASSLQKSLTVIKNVLERG